MTNELTLMIELDGMLGNAIVEYENTGLDVTIHRINGQPANAYSSEDLFVLQSKLVALIASGRTEVRL